MKPTSGSPGSEEDVRRTDLSRPNGERGYTLVEILIILIAAGIVLALGFAYSLDWVNRGRVRSSAYQIQTLMQLARASAISRNRVCRFQIDSMTHAVSIVDLNEPADPSDDATIRSMALSERVSFTRPDAGPAITLALLSGTCYGVSFSPDGSVTTGGVVSIFAGGRYDQVTLYGAGGTKVERYDGSSWVLGS